MSEEWEQIELPSNLIGVNDLSIETAKTLQSTINKMDLGPMGA